MPATFADTLAGVVRSTADFELLHHYSTCSCVRFPFNDILHKLWTKDVPVLSFSYPYLLHQILAVAALHLYVEDPTRTELSNVATQHRALALKHVKPSLSNVVSDSCSISLFAFAGLTAIYAFGELAIMLEQGSDEHDYIGQLIACFRLSRGIGTIVGAREQGIRDSWASDMINISADAELESLRSMGLKFAHADALFELINTRTRAPDDVTAYTNAAVRCLEYIQLQMWQPDQENPRIYHLIMTWPHEIDLRCYELFELRDPVALILLAYYAVLMSMRKRLWWLARWPKLLLQQIGSVLGAEWDPWLEWPRAMLKTLGDSPVASSALD